MKLHVKCLFRFITVFLTRVTIFDKGINCNCTEIVAENGRKREGRERERKRGGWEAEDRE